MAYYVEMKDVYRLGAEELHSFRNEIEDASDTLTSYIASFSDSDAIAGEAGDSMKRYMIEVHGPLMENLVGALGQLLTDYSHEYSSKYEGGETSGDSAGKYPESGLREVVDKLSAVPNSFFTVAEKDLRKASHHIPEGCSVSVPNASSVVSAFEKEGRSVQQLKRQISDIEGEGLSAFSAESSRYQNLMTSLKTAFALCAGGSFTISNYQSGMFSKVADSTGLRDSFLASMADQAEKSDETTNCLKSNLEHLQECNRIEMEEAAKEKEAAAWWGLGAQVGLFVLGAVALVGTAGAATPVLFALGAAMGGASLYSSAKGIESRLQQIVDIRSGDYGADLKDSKIAGLSEAKKSGKVVKDGLKIEYELNKAPKGTGATDLGGVGKGAQGMTKDLGKIGMDYAYDHIAGDVTDEGTKLGLDVTKEGVDAGYDIVMDKVIDGTLKKGNVVQAVAGAACSAVQAVADYKVEQCDRLIEQSQASIDKEQALKQSLDSKRTYATSVSW